MEYYWELIQHDGTRLEIPPAGVEVIKRRMANGDPINTRSAVIPANQIKYFRQTDKPFSVQPLLDAASQAFNEPQLNEDGSIVCKWVKKNVTQDRWNKYYAHHPYKRLGEDGTMVTIAMRIPVHLIDVNLTTPCTDEEVRQIESKH